jgi:hypothetical protein
MHMPAGKQSRRDAGEKASYCSSPLRLTACNRSWGTISNLAMISVPPVSPVRPTAKSTSLPRGVRGRRARPAARVVPVSGRPRGDGTLAAVRARPCAFADRGLGTAAFSNIETTLILTEAPLATRSRVMGIVTMCIGTGPLGVLEIGALSEQLRPLRGDPHHGLPRPCGIEPGRGLLIKTRA